MWLAAVKVKTDLQRQKAVYAYFTSIYKQILPVGFAEQHTARYYDNIVVLVSL